MDEFSDDGTRKTDTAQTPIGGDPRVGQTADQEPAAAWEAREFDPAATTCGDLQAMDEQPQMDSESTRVNIRSSPNQPDFIGPYKVRDILGSGGMGIVYLAEQKEPKRLIALKTIQPGRASEITRKRFHHEAQILAHLHHPLIAQVYEAGNARLDGCDIAYFAMEYINGLPLDKYVISHNLTIGQRLHLIAQICDAVQYAHQKGVIHRDLKPSNIMVESPESSAPRSASAEGFLHAVGRPKILDFGIARIDTPDLNATDHTNTGQIMGTLNYMSPEQASGGMHLVDTRSDVYSLGVIAYQILCGALPYKLERGVTALLAIQSANPTRLSSYNPDLRGDIEIIVSRALEKDMDRRYQSPGDMAADIRRYLQNEPILARPAGSWYHVRKFAMRNRALVASFIAMMFLLIAGIIGTTTGMERARRASAEAKKEASQAKAARLAADRQAKEAHRARDEADQVSEFLVRLFTDADPFDMSDSKLVRKENMTARQLIDRGVEKIRTELTDQPGTRIRVLNSLGRVYSSLTLLEEAEPLLRESVELSHNLHGPNHIDTIQSQRSLGRLLEHMTQYDDALTAYQAAYLGALHTFGQSHIETIWSRQGIAKLYLTRGDLARAEPMLAENLEMARKELGPKHQIVADTVNAMAWLYYNQGNFAKSEDLFRQAADIGRLRFSSQGDKDGSNNPNMAIILTNLAWVMVKQDKLEQGEATITEAIAIFNRTLPVNHWRKKNAESVLASIRTRQNRFAEAEVLLLSSYTIIKDTTGDRSPYSRVMRERLAYLYTRWDRPEEAERWSKPLSLTEH